MNAFLSFLKPVIKPIADGLVAQAEAQKPAILAELAAQNVTAASAVASAIEAQLTKAPQFAAVAKFVDIPAAVQTAMPTLIAAMGSEEDVLFEAVLAHVRTLEAAAFA